MKVWSVFSLVIIFHVVVIGLLLIQPGCQSQPSTAPDPAMTAPSATSGETYVPPAQPDILDPAFNSGVQGATVATGRQLSAPTRPTGVTRTEPDTGLLTPVLEPVQDELTIAPIDKEYKVQKGDTLTGIARREGVSFADLLAANGLSRSSTIYVGQSLLIPMARPAATNNGPEIEHSARQVVVVKGDTLGKIAARQGTTVSVLKALNGLTSDTIFVGQKLALPEGSGPLQSLPSSPVVQPTVQPSAGQSSYTVKSGDTPSGIAKRYGISTAQLMSSNGITDPRKLYVGQVLVIPGANSPSGSTTNSTNIATRQVQPNSAPVTTTITTTPEPVADDPMSILEALEDEDLPFVEVEAVEEGPQPGI